MPSLKRARKGWKRLGRLRDDAVIVGGVLVSAAFGLRFTVPPPTALPDMAPAGIGLLVVSIGLALAYYVDTGEELDLLQEAGERELSPLPRKILTGILAFLGALSALVYASTSPLFFGLVLIVIKLLELWGAGTAKREIREGLDALLEKSAASKGHQRAQVLDRYYFDRPWTRQLAIAVAAVAVSVVAVNSQVGAAGDLSNVASLMLIGAIVLNEFLAYRWRARRDDAWHAIR